MSTVGLVVAAGGFGILLISLAENSRQAGPLIAWA
jgi:hypothetical protein